MQVVCSCMSVRLPRVWAIGSSGDRILVVRRWRGPYGLEVGLANPAADCFKPSPYNKGASHIDGR